MLRLTSPIQLNSPDPSRSPVYRRPAPRRCGARAFMEATAGVPNSLQMNDGVFSGHVGPGEGNVRLVLAPRSLQQGPSPPREEKDSRHYNTGPPGSPSGTISLAPGQPPSPQATARAPSSDFHSPLPEIPCMCKAPTRKIERPFAFHTLQPFPVRPPDAHSLQVGPAEDASRPAKLRGTPNRAAYSKDTWYAGWVLTSINRKVSVATH